MVLPFQIPGCCVDLGGGWISPTRMLYKPKGHVINVCLVLGMGSYCVICAVEYSDLSQHLKKTHGVENNHERLLLLKLGSGRIDLNRTACPVPGCVKLPSRMDRHLKSHTELTPSLRNEAVRKAKRRQVVRQLAVLRASEPSVPLVSRLSYDVEDGDVGNASGALGNSAAAQMEALTYEVRSMKAAFSEMSHSLQKLFAGAGPAREFEPAAAASAPSALPSDVPLELANPADYPFPAHVPVLGKYISP